ncbi:MAG: hypothetical protein UU21_C0001G0062 [Candidatus Levybacteria bacterium GW2011_GWA2_40_8]|nr:MAG: hypothetical protein UU21_C0001G0062 [Candidatus Levybacteria bacterium GW2011_GWA2_40_8]
MQGMRVLDIFEAIPELTGYSNRIRYLFTQTLNIKIKKD